MTRKDLDKIALFFLAFVLAFALGGAVGARTKHDGTPNTCFAYPASLATDAAYTGTGEWVDLNTGKVVGYSTTEDSEIIFCMHLSEKDARLVRR